MTTHRQQRREQRGECASMYQLRSVGEQDIPMVDCGDGRGRGDIAVDIVMARRPLTVVVVEGMMINTVEVKVEVEVDGGEPPFLPLPSGLLLAVLDFCPSGRRQRLTCL
jgi:hypothetical protein